MSENQNKVKIVAVDGPAGSGKSTLCREVSRRLGWAHVNTGSLYRAVGYALKANNLCDSDEQLIVDNVDALLSEITRNPETGAIFFEGKDISEEILSPEMSLLASKTAKIQRLREKLLPVQRQWAFETKKGAFVEGRDVGTVVFPDADVKLFLTAGIEERAQRRLAQMKEGQLETVKEEIGKRDSQDSKRDAAPLVKAEDAIEFDTGAYSLDDCIEAIADLVLSKT